MVLVKEKSYKCGYNHCLKPDEKVPESESVLVGKRRFHKECAELREQIERIKRIYFDHIDNKSDYVQVVGVVNHLIFKKGYSADYIEFLLMYLSIFYYNLKSPYALHRIAENSFIKEKYDNKQKKEGVVALFDRRCRKDQ